MPNSYRQGASRCSHHRCQHLAELTANINGSLETVSSERLTQQHNYNQEAAIRSAAVGRDQWSGGLIDHPNPRLERALGLVARRLVEGVGFF